MILYFFSYTKFPALNADLFLQPSKRTVTSHNNNSDDVTPAPTTTQAEYDVTRRTKQEVKNAQKLCKEQRGEPVLWAK